MNVKLEVSSSSMYLFCFSMIWMVICLGELSRIIAFGSIFIAALAFIFSIGQGTLFAAPKYGYAVALKRLFYGALVIGISLALCHFIEAVMWARWAIGMVAVSAVFWLCFVWPDRQPASHEVKDTSDSKHIGIGK